MKVIALGGSNSKKSINKELAKYVSGLFANDTSELLDVNNFELPMYSIDKEEAIGIPENAVAFAEKIDAADLIILSLAENNGSYNAGFKNLIDWVSRIKGRKLWGGKNMLLMATSPGARGGMEVLSAAKNRFPFMGAEIKGTFSLPVFHENFNIEKGITNEDLKQQLLTIVDEIN